MNEEWKICVGGLVISFSGWLPPPEQPEILTGFFVREGAPDIRVAVSEKEQIDYPVRYAPQWESAYFRMFRADGTVHCYYRRDQIPAGSDHAHRYFRQDDPDTIFLEVCLKRAFWNSRQLLSCLGIEALLLRRKRAMLHDSWIERDGAAVLFSGVSGIGKSTQAALWQENRGTSLKNGDRVLLRNIGGTEYACGLPYAGSSGICETGQMPIRAIVMLGQDSENRIRRLSCVEAVKRLLTQLPVPKWEPSVIGKALDVAQRVAQSTPIYELMCLPDESAVRTLDEELKKGEPEWNRGLQNSCI